ncbi:hypothetical protein N7468_008562 [Penicillium chermesinum]|uniref:Chromo domain-containing protein n=1 Tax=Penicillium chermesinum TaxID=63820 RepID=A0A9W9NPZ1_9EURO|nr:uncharacterized protein N7468_008562 [Penicillium chermesinum]KAJ5224020.1 hypothetical protein N7468_008562 [Penicillium chermesinum]
MHQWPLAIPAIQMALNSSLKTPTGMTPHQQLYGMELRQPWDLLRQAAQPDKTFSARVDAETAIKFAAMAMKKRYDAQHAPIHFTEGQLVYLRLRTAYDIPANVGLPRKLAQKYAGPFKVLRRVGKPAYHLELPADDARWRRIHPVISVAYLEPAPQGDDPWKRSPEEGEHRPTTDDRFPQDTVYEVEELLNKRVRHARGRQRKDGTRRLITEYLVRWTNRPETEDEWVNVEDLIGCAELIREYDERHA